METLEKQIAQKAKSVPQERNIAPEERYVSGGEEELEFTKTTPFTHIRKEAAQRDKEMSLGDKDSYSRGQIGKKTSPNWDSETGLGRDINADWESIEHSVSSRRQQIVVTDGISKSTNSANGEKHTATGVHHRQR